MDSNLYKKEHIYALINHIEQNLSDKIDTRYLSELGFVSHMQLYRDFYSITGHSVKEYVRKRRLSNALALIRHSNMNLVDISYECGYTSQQILCTNVKNAIGMTPLEYRQSGEHYYFPPFNSFRERQITVTTEVIPETLCVKYYQSQLIGIEKAAVEALLSLAPDFKGRIFGRNGEQKGPRFCYELYLTEAESMMEQLKSSSFIIGGKIHPVSDSFVVTTVKNREDEINAAWDYLYTDWMGFSMFEYTGGFWFEEYILKNGKPKKLRLYLPIRKKSDYMKITIEKPGNMKFIVSRAEGSMAEQISSENVIKYLEEYHPAIIKNSKQFYICKSFGSCTCGMRITEDIKLNKELPLHILNIADCLYAVLHSSINSDGTLYQDILYHWVCENGLSLNSDVFSNSDISQKNALSDHPIFAVYDVSSNYDNPQVMLYCPIKMV